MSLIGRVVLVLLHRVRHRTTRQWWHVESRTPERIALTRYTVTESGAIARTRRSFTPDEFAREF